jgi:peptidoglycan/xylan/chitin deacetylase (PgdA/CDA1 family)
MFIHQIPSFIPKVFPNLTWKIANEVYSKEVYFTFDDGPTPEITDFVLECLANYEAKATFFCIGKNMVSNDRLVEKICADGHAIGNHTMNHANAWKYSLESYVEDYLACSDVIRSFNITSAGFRPPYGRINTYIYKQLSQIEPVYMWTYLSGDYNADLTAQSIIRSAITGIKPGSILVFHDSLKAFPRLKVILPVLLDFCQRENYTLKAL